MRLERQNCTVGYRFRTEEYRVVEDEMTRRLQSDLK
jgi:hypothetical protein